MSLQSDSGATTGGIAVSPGGSKRVAAPGVVRVNLIPPEIAEARQVRVTALAMAGAAVLSLAVVGLLYHQQSSDLADANSQLAVAQTQQSQLTGEQARLGNVNALYAKVDAAQAMLARAQAPQILWSRYLEDLRLQLPEHVWLTSMTATESAPGTTAASGSSASRSTTGAPATSTSTGIGTLSFAGGAYTHNDVANLLDGLSNLRGVNDPLLATSGESLVGSGSAAVPSVSWTLTAGLTPQALGSSYTSANKESTP